MIFDKLPLNPFAFAQLTQRQRMMNQLRGAGLGRNGLEHVLHTNGGQVGFLAGVSRLGMLGEEILERGTIYKSSTRTTVPTTEGAITDPYQTTAVVAPAPYKEQSTVQLYTDQQDMAAACRGVLCPTGSYCEGGTCIPSKVVEQTAQEPVAVTALDPREQEQKTYADDGGGDSGDSTPRYSDGTKVNAEDVDDYDRGDGGSSSDDRYDGRSYDPGGGGGGGGPSPSFPSGDPAQADPNVAAMVAAQAVEERGIPWGWILGGVAALGVGYKLLGKRR